MKKQWANKKFLKSTVLFSMLFVLLAGIVLPVTSFATSGSSNSELAFYMDGSNTDWITNAVAQIHGNDPDTKGDGLAHSFVVAKGGLWGDGTKFVFQDTSKSNDENGSDGTHMGNRYSATYYCSGNTTQLSPTSDSDGTIKIEASVYLQLGEKFYKDKKIAMKGIKDFGSGSKLSQPVQTKIEFSPKQEPQPVNQPTIPTIPGITLSYNIVDGQKDLGVGDSSTSEKYYYQFNKGFKNAPVPGSNAQIWRNNSPSGTDGPDILAGCDIPPFSNNSIPNLMLMSKDATLKNQWQAALDHAQGKSPDGTIQDPGAGTGGNAGGGEVDQCHHLALNPLTWLICPVIDGLGSMADQVHGTLQEELTVGSIKSSDNPSLIFCNGSGTNASCIANKEAWSKIRNIALGLMVIAGLIVLIAQIIGIEILDAYMIRKVLPRLLVVAIGITLSWELLRWLVIFTNDLGLGIEKFIEQPFKNLPYKDFSEKSMHGSLTGFLLIPGILAAAGGIFGILSLVVTAALAFLVAFVVIILRGMLVTLLIILAPLAIVAYILPNTEKYYKLWWSNLIRALLMYPIIMAMIAAGYVFSRIAGSSDEGFSSIISVVAYFMPYMLLPLSFKFAGGAMAAIGGAVNQRAQGGFQGLQNFRAGRRKKMAADYAKRASEGNLIKGAGNAAFTRNPATWLNRGVMIAGQAKNLGYDPRAWRGQVSQNLRTHEDLARQKAIKESAEFGSIRGNDALLHAVLAEGGLGDRAVRTKIGDAMFAQQRHANPALTRAAFDANGTNARTIDAGVHAINRARYSMGDETLVQAAAHSFPGTGSIAGQNAGQIAAFVHGASNDPIQRTNLIAATRATAKEAGVASYGDANFGGHMAAQAYFDQHEVNDVSIAHVNSLLTRSSLESSEGSTIARARADDLARMMPEMDDLLLESYVGTAEGGPGSEEEVGYRYAQLADVYDSMSGAGSTAKDRQIAEGVMAQTVDLNRIPPDVQARLIASGTVPEGQQTATHRQVMEAVRNGPENSVSTARFRDTRREYTNALQAQLGGTGGSPVEGG